MSVPMSTTYKIDDEAIPEPTAAPVLIEPLHGDASGRTDDGVMHTELITVKRKIAMQYDALTQEQLSPILTKLMHQYFEFTYLDPVDGVKTIECYGLPLSQEPHQMVYYNGLWRNIKFDCIER